MRISGKLLIKVGLGALAALTAVGIYQEYKEIRKEEDEHIKDLEESGIDFDEEDSGHMETGEALKKAAKKFGENVRDELLYGDGWKAVGVGVGLGALNYIFYAAGHNDCFDRMEGEVKKGIQDAYNEGELFGFASGRYWTGDHIEAANPEHAKEIIHNLDNWEKLYAGTDKMKWKPDDSLADNRVVHLFDMMKENTTYKED